PISTETTVTVQIEPLRPRLRERPPLGIAPVSGGIGFSVADPGVRGIEYRRLVHDAGGLALQPMIEPREIRIARPEISMVDEIVLVRTDPQLLMADARLDIFERCQHAGLKDVEPGRDVKSGDLDRATEIVRP